MKVPTKDLGSKEGKVVDCCTTEGREGRKAVCRGLAKELVFWTQGRRLESLALPRLRLSDPRVEVVHFHADNGNGMRHAVLFAPHPCLLF